MYSSSEKVVRKTTRGDSGEARIFSGGGKAVHPRHLDVEKDDVRRGVGRQAHGVGPRPSRSLRPSMSGCASSTIWSDSTTTGVVVCYDDPHVRLLSPPERGTLAKTVQPPPSPEPTRNVPPSARTRSSIEASPMPGPLPARRPPSFHHQSP